MIDPVTKPFPGSATVGSDFRMLSKQSIFDRLQAMEPGIGRISRSAMILFCKTSMPGWPEDLGNDAQARLSKAFYWLDKGRLKIGYYKGKAHVYLHGAELVPNTRKDPAKVVPAILWGADGVKLTWR